VVEFDERDLVAVLWTDPGRPDRPRSPPPAKPYAAVGFRRSHFDAVAAQRLMSRRPDLRVAGFADVQLVTLGFQACRTCCTGWGSARRSRCTGPPGGTRTRSPRGGL